MAETQQERLTRLGLFNPSALNTDEDKLIRYKDADTIGNARIKEIDALETTHGQSGISEENKKRIEENKVNNLKFGQEGYKPMLQATAGDKASLDAELMSFKNIESGPSIYRGMDVKYNRFDDSISEPVVLSTGDEFYTQPLEDREYDKFGRRLFENKDYAAELTKQGLAVNFNATDKEKNLALALEAKQKRLGAWAYAPQEMEEKFAKRNDGYNTYGERVGDSSAIDALQTATTRLGGKLLSGVGESLEFLGKEDQAFQQREQSRLDKQYPGEKVSEWRNELSKSIENVGKFLSDSGDKIKYGDVEEFYGYDKSGSKMTEEVWNELKDGKILNAVEKVSASGVLNLIAESAPEMVMYFHPATFGLTYAGNVAEAKKEAEKINGNKEISNTRMSAILIGEAISAGLESFAIGKVTGIGEVTAKAGEIASRLSGKVPESILKDAASYAINKSGKIGTAMAAEGAQEVVQEGQRILTTEYGQKDINTEANFDKLGQALVGGSLAGGGIRTGAEVIYSAGDIYEKANNSGLGVSDIGDYAKKGIDTVSTKAKEFNKTSESGDDTVATDDNIDDETDTIELDDETRAMHEINFNDAIAGLDELDSKTIDASTDMKEIAKHVADIGKIDTLLKSSIVSGAITDADTRKAAIARLNANNRRIKDAITGTITNGDEKAMNDLFSDPITSEKMLRSVAEELDFDDAKIESNFMQAGYNAGLDESIIKDTIEESKIVRRLNNQSEYQTGKTASQVASEVSTGKSGYLTFRKNALDGIESGNINKINRNIEKLENFANIQSEKLSKLTTGLNSVEDAINNQINEEIANATKSGKTITREQVLQNYIDGKAKGKLDVQTSSNENDGKGYRTTINYSDVAKKIVNPDYNGGIYSIINSVDQESKDLNRLNELTQKQAGKLPAYNKQFESENEVDYKDRIKQLIGEVAKGYELYKEFDKIDPDKLNNELAIKVKEYRSKKDELKSIKAKLEKLKSAKEDKTKVNDKNKSTEINTKSKSSEPEIKRVIADDIVAPVMPKNTEFVAPQIPKNEQTTITGSESKMPDPFAKKDESNEYGLTDEQIARVDSIVSKSNTVEDALRILKKSKNYDEIPKDLKIKLARAIGGNQKFTKPNNSKQTETKKIETKSVEPENKSTKVTSDGLDMTKYPIPKATVIPSFVGSVNDFASSIPTPDEVSKANVEFEKAPKIDNESIANFENLDSVDAAEKSEVVKELENELAIAKDKIKSTKANIEKVKLFKQKSYDNKEYENVDNAQMLIENYYASIDNIVARIDSIKAKLSGSAEIDLILKTSLSSGLTQSKMYDDKGKEIVGKFQKISAKDIVESSKKTSNRLSGMKIDEITQDEKVKAYANDAIKTIENMLKPIKVGTMGKGNGVVKPILETLQIRDDLFRGLLFNANGSVNRNIAVAVAMAADETRALMHSKLAFNSREDVMSMLGYSQEFEVSNAAYNALAFEGKFKKLIADDLATSIFNNIAIKGKEDSDIELVAKMRADAGQVALLFMQEKDYIEKLTESTIPIALYKEIAKNDGDEKSMTMQSNEFDSDGKTIPMVRLKKDRITRKDRLGDKKALANKEAKIEAENKIFDEQTNRLKKELDRMNVLLAIESTKKNVKFKPSETTDKKVKNSKIANMNDETLKTLNVLQSEAFEMNDGVELMFNLLKDKTISESQLLKIMGYETTKDLEGKAYDTVESAIARNIEILDSINELKALRARVEDPNDDATNELYFDYFFGRNGRYYLDSVGINPQTGKELYRWLVTPKAHNIDVDFSSEKVKSEQHENFFKLGIAQAFGYGIDKEKTSDIYAFAEAAMMQDEQELLKVFSNEGNTHIISGYDGKEHKIGIDHVGHTMQAIAALRKYREADNGKKPFTASLSIEFDAVTSGFILKLLQLPILEFSELKKWLAKGGIFLGSEEKLAEIKSTNDMIALGKLIDSYKTLASEMKDDKIFESDVNTTRNGSEIPAKRKLFDAMKPLLGSLKEEFDDGVNGITERVTKEGRELFKYQFMPFNYSAGLKALNKNLGYEMIKNLPDMMIKDGMTKDSKARKLINVLHEKELKDSEVSEFIKKLQNESFENITIGKTKIGEQMRLLIEDVYGSQVNTILSNEFKELMDANNTVNSAFKAVFMAWKSAYDKEIETLRAGGEEITNSDVDAIVKKLKDKFPMIKSPLSTDNYLDDSSGIAIHNTKLSSNKINTYGPAKTYVNPNKNNGQATLTVQSMIREFSEAINSGSVIPIHYIDGSFMTKGLAKGGILGVHDAKVVGVGNALSATKDYNENVWEGSRDYSYINELFELLDKIKKDNDYTSHRNSARIGSGKNELTFNDVYNMVKELNDKVTNNRKILFGLNSKTMHMTAIEGTDYTNNGTEDTKGWINPEVEKNTGYADKSKKSKTSSSAKEQQKRNTPEFNKLPFYKEGQKNMIYAGIGSRETPKHILEKMTKISKELESYYKLQTGYKSKTYGKINEEGADKAFSDGTKNKELFGPDMATTKEMNIAKELHPNWNALIAKGTFAAKLMARNTFQVFGKNLDTPVDFVLFYAEEQKDSIRPKGGTGQAVEMARLKGIPTINMADKNWREKLNNILSEVKVEVKVETKESIKPEANDANKLYRNEDGTIRFGNNAYTKEVKSFDELIYLSNQFDELMQAKQNVAKSGTDVHNYLKDLWKMIAKSGVEFKPVKIQFVKKIDVGGLGVHKMYDGKTKSIQLSYNEEYQAIESPIRIMMHEYVHALTVTALRNNPELMSLANKLRDHAIKEVGIDKVSEYYGFSDTIKNGKIEPNEFIAELMTSPRFQKLLSGVKGLGNKNTSLLEQVKKVFNTIVNYVSKDNKLVKESSALIDGLEIVYKLLDIKNENATAEVETETNSTPTSGSESEVQSYKQFSKDDIEAAKDIMSKNKKECE